MELIIDKNGNAVDVEDVSVTIICESKEEADRLREGMASGRVRLMEWHPIEIRDEEVIGLLPEDGQMVLISVIYARGERGVIKTMFCREGELCYFEDWGMSRVTAWAPMPEPYEKREE